MCDMTHSHMTIFTCMCIHMRVCACVCERVCACVCVCVVCDKTHSYVRHDPSTRDNVHVSVLICVCACV